MTLKPIDRWAHEAPGFNRKAADAVYATVAKMDSDEAVMFTRMVADAILADDLMVHGETIAKVLYAEQAKRVELLKSHLARTAIAKSRAGQDADAELAALHEITKSRIGDLFNHLTGNSSDKRAERARKQQRGLATGQFVKQTNDIIHESEVPHSEAHERRLNIPTPPADWKLDSAQRAAYQQAYHQVAALVQPYQRLPRGTAFLHLTRDNGKDAKIITIPDRDGQLAAADFDPREGKIVQSKISRLPTEDAEGAYFSIFDTLGMPNVGAAVGGAVEGGALDPARVKRYKKEHEFSHPSDEFAPSQRVFRRVVAGSSLIEDTLGNVAPPPARMALKVAQHVGTLGPTVQDVVGPTVDRAKYRYRGTERKLDPKLLTAIDDDGVRAAKVATAATDSHRQVRASAEQRDALLNRNAARHAERGAQIRERWAQAGYDHKAGLLDRGQLKAQARKAQVELAGLDRARVEADAAANATHAAALASHGQRLATGRDQHAALKAQIVARGDLGDDKRWRPGATLNYFRGRVPTPELHELHLQAGTVPPSEGIILDEQGRVVSQAVGYGEDHYVPFNLRGLRKMRGGSYVRTRTWGGPTAEDIRTSLLGGATSLTVVSNSGVFNVKFDPTFKGGRRHNDKAHRMIGRYEHLLDAVRQERVARAQIDPGRLDVLRAKAAAKANPAYNAQGFKDEFERLQREERKNPELSPGQVDEASREWATALAAEHGSKGKDSSVESLIDEIATNRARSEHADATRRWRTEDQAPWRVQAREANPEDRTTFVVPPPESPESMRYAQTQLLTDSSPTVQAQILAREFGADAGLASYLETAKRTNQANVRRMRLDGPGYEAALKALQEQFPYYIQSTTFEPWHNQRQMVDTGYVRVGANRPAAAAVGLYDSASSAGKVRADSIRGQLSSPTPALTRGVPEEAAVTVAAPAASVPRASEESEVKRRERVDRDMLDALLAQKVFGPNATVAANGLIRESANLESNHNFPPTLKPFYAGAVSRDDLVDELKAQPKAMRDKIGAAVAWFVDNDAFPEDDAKLTAALRAFQTGGRSSTVSAETDPSDLLDRPDREYAFAHEQGPEYVPGNGQSSEDVQTAYVKDELVKPLVESGALPAEVYATDFPARAAKLRTRLLAQDEVVNDWAEGRQIGLPPAVEPAEHEQQVRGLIQAMTLHTRFGEADGIEQARYAAGQAEKQAKFEEAQAHTVVQHEPQIDMSVWAPAQKQRLVEDEDYANLQIDMIRDSKGNAAAAFFASAIKDERERRQALGLEALNPFLNPDPAAMARADAAEAAAYPRRLNS